MVFFNAQGNILTLSGINLSTIVFLSAIIGMFFILNYIVIIPIVDTYGFKKPKPDHLMQLSLTSFFTLFDSIILISMVAMNTF